MRIEWQRDNTRPTDPACVGEKKSGRHGQIAAMAPALVTIERSLRS